MVEVVRNHLIRTASDLYGAAVEGVTTIGASAIGCILAQPIAHGRPGGRLNYRWITAFFR
jgi:hypothetical protein